MALTEIQPSAINEIIEKNEPCLVVFSRQNCHVCQEVIPKVEDIAKNLAGKLSFYYVDVEEDKSVLKQFALKGVPQLLFFNQGELYSKLAGNVEEEDIEEKIDEIL